MSPRISVLLVEDNALVGAILERVFQRLGCEVRLISDPHQLETELRSSTPSLVVSDLSMPGRTGIEVLSAVKAHAPSIVRCLLSGELGTLSLEDFSRIEPCALVAKPCRTAELELLVKLATRAIDSARVRERTAAGP